MTFEELVDQAIVMLERRGRRAQARTELTAAVELYRAMEMTFWLPQAEAALAQAG